MSSHVQIEQARTLGSCRTWLLLGCLLLTASGCGSAPAEPESNRNAASRAEVSADLELLRDQLESGAVRASSALIDGRFASLREQRAFRRLMLDHQTAAELDIVTPDEPGTPLTVSGTVRDTEGQAIAGVTIYIYQTDARGWYGTHSSDDEEHVRIYGVLRTGDDGRYRFRTIRPGAYAHAPTTATHIHYLFRKDGYERARGSGPPSLFFADDPLVTDADRREIVDDGGVIADVEKHEDGSHSCVYDLVMRRVRR